MDECHIAGEGVIDATGQGGSRSDGAARLLGKCQKRILERVVPSCLQGDSEIGRPGYIRIGARFGNASESEARLRLGQGCEPFPKVENRFAFLPKGLAKRAAALRSSPAQESSVATSANARATG